MKYNAILRGMKDTHSCLVLGYIIFDLDGTLIDSMAQHREIFGKILDRDFRIPPSISEEIYAKTAGKPLDEQFDLVLQQYNFQDVNIALLVNKFWQTVSEIIFPPFDDVPSSIKTLVDAHYLLFITSGSTNTVAQAKLKHAGLQEYFHLVLGSDYSSTGSKKGAAHFRLIQQYVGLGSDEFKQNTLFVGDGKHDIQLAKEEGLVGVLRIDNSPPNDIKPDMCIHNLFDLLRNLRNDTRHSSTFVKISDLRQKLGM